MSATTGNRLLHRSDDPFHLSLGGLSNPESSRRGNLYGMIGMTVAVLATVFGPRVTGAGIPWIIGAMVVGASIGLYAARVVKIDADARTGRADAQPGSASRRCWSDSRITSIRRRKPA